MVAASDLRTEIAENYHEKYGVTSAERSGIPPMRRTSFPTFSVRSASVFYLRPIQSLGFDLGLHGYA